MVYLVDDEPAVLKALSRLLRSAGLESATFGSPEEFLARIDPDAEGCVVLDVAMPGLDGLALQEALASRGVALPTLFLTGHGDIPQSVRAMKGGAVDFLTKPVDDAVFLRAVREALERGRAGRSRPRGVRPHPGPPRNPDPAGTRSARGRRRRAAQQADRRRSGHRGEDREGAPGPGHGEDGSPLGRRAGPDGGPRRSPAASAVWDQGPITAGAPPATLTAHVTRLKPLVAVVDDEEAVRRALERLLRSAGIETETFSTGGAMLEDLARRRARLHRPGPAHARHERLRDPGRPGGARPSYPGGRPDRPRHSRSVRAGDGGRRGSLPAQAGGRRAAPGAQSCCAVAGQR